MPILVDTSVWIEYFRHGEGVDALDSLIDRDLVVTNDLILVELLPSIRIRGQHELASLLCEVSKLDIDIDWERIASYQYECLSKGINGLGVPDLIIAQNSKQNRCPIYTLDKHFKLMRDVIGFQLFEP